MLSVSQVRISVLDRAILYTYSLVNRLWTYRMKLLVLAVAGSLLVLLTSCNTGPSGVVGAGIGNVHGTGAVRATVMAVTTNGAQQSIHIRHTDEYVELITAEPPYPFVVGQDYTIVLVGPRESPQIRSLVSVLP